MGRRIARSPLMTGAAAVAVAGVVVLTALAVLGKLTASDVAAFAALGLALFGLAYVALLVRRLHGRLAKLQASHKHAGEAARKQVAALAQDGTDVRSLLAQDRSEVAVALEEVLRRSDRTDEALARVTTSLEGQLVELKGLQLTLQAVRDEAQVAEQRRAASADHLLDSNDFVQLEALLDLRSLLSPHRSMPATRGWALAPTSLLALVDAVLDRQPELVVECGSGVSSIWLGYALQRTGRGRCVSLEHDAEYAEQTREDLRRHGLDHLVEVRHAPLVPVSASSEAFRWYDPASFADLSGIGVVLVDGPPGATAPQARYPAVELLRERCTAEALFLVDDANRPDEAAIVERWMAEGRARTVARSRAEKGWHLVALVAA